jgi:hypothetical protein
MPRQSEPSWPNKALHPTGCAPAAELGRSSALRADERARVAELGFSAQSAVEPSFERHRCAATSSSRARAARLFITGNGDGSHKAHWETRFLPPSGVRRLRAG